MIKQIPLNFSYFSTNKANALNIFWIGFIIYTLGYITGTTGDANMVLCQLVQIVGLVLFLPSGFYLIQFNIAHKFLRGIFGIYCFWLLLIVVRGGIDVEYNFLKTLLFDANYGIFLYLAPLIVLFPSTFSFYRKIFDVIILLAIIFLIYSFVFLDDLLDRSSDTQEIIEYFCRTLSLPCGFILMTFRYHAKRKVVIAGTVMVISLLFSIYKARRGLSFICSTVLIFSYILYLLNTRKKELVFYFSTLLFVFSIIYFWHSYQVETDGFWGLLMQRGGEDTRTGVENCFYKDTTIWEWIFGKGLQGVYYCSGVVENELTDKRYLIETGYLQIILKGGVIGLILYLLILVPASVLGLFYSNNLISKASGIWILISILSLYPATVNYFNLNYLLIWVAVSICYSREIRALPDDMVNRFINMGSIKLHKKRVLRPIELK